MPNILKAFPYDLMKTVNEEGFLNSVKNRLSGKKQEQPASPDVAQPHPEVAAETPLHNVISEMLDTPVGESRVVLYMNHEELVKLYLQPDPKIRATLAAQLMTESKYSLLRAIMEVEDQGVTAPALAKVKAQSSAKPNDPKTPVQDAKTKPDQKPEQKPDDKTPPKNPPPKQGKVNVSSLEQGYKFSDIYKDAGAAHYSVLLNIPDQLKKEYLEAQDKKPVLEKMLDPKYYVMTINNGDAKKIGAQVDKASDFSDKMAIIDPNIIVNYPKKQMIKQAKDLWNSKYRDKQNSADAVAQRARDQDKEQPVDSTDETPAAGLEQKPDQQSAQSPSSSESPDKKLADIKKIYSKFSSLSQNGKANRDDLRNILDQMGPYLK